MAYMAKYKQWAGYSEAVYHDKILARADVTPAEKLADGIDTFIDAVGRITAWSSFALALVMGGNVLLRYGFNTGSVWSQELEWHLMSPICLFGMSYALRHGEHVRVDVLFASYSQRNKYLVEFITALLSMAISPDHHQAVVGLRPAILEHRRGHRQSGRHFRPLHSQGPDSRSASPCCFCNRWRRRSSISWRGEESARMPFNEILAILMLVGVLRPAAGGHPGRADAGDHRSGVRLYRLRPAAVQSAAKPHLRRGDELHADRHAAVRLHGRDAGEIASSPKICMDVIAHAAGNLRGGLGIGIIVVGVFMGATTGIVGATVVTLGLLTLPTLLRRGYDKGLACGTICASGTLGQIIPPSLILILLADILQRIGRHAVRRRHDPRPDAGGHLRHLHSRAGHLSSRNGAGGIEGGARSRFPWRARGQTFARRCCRRSHWSGRCWARSSPASRRQPRLPRWARSAPSW